MLKVEASITSLLDGLPVVDRENEAAQDAALLQLHKLCRHSHLNAADSGCKLGGDVLTQRSQAAVCKQTQPDAVIRGACC